MKAAGRPARSVRWVVVDSCGWLEYLAGGSNAAFFEAALLDTTHLLVPGICLYEVGKRMLVQHGEAAAREVLEMMHKARIVHLNDAALFEAAKTSAQHGLGMADAMIWQSAQLFNAALLTQDAGLKDMPQVTYQKKPSGKP